ncbi:hypothetical protein DWB68_10170 [Galactobacter valiniphilus]|uniref:Capsid maturation protease n=1 Tax=Galactobacter valiniphilus TaxID=2676122 RepID=A0A399J8J3_9MICC|nr:hypothetical protein [Galactobacter valiniphilus]RII41883.1 hypothetical protein DWB68_10170 [Galactobacter valiniphilus]
MTTTIHGWATESATTAPPVERVTESGAVTSSGGRFLVTLITPGRGASGFYTPEVLEAAATAKVFPEGTAMHLDHQTETERYERGVRSVATLAAVLTEDARWDGQALVAEARPIGLNGQHMREAAGVAHVSIASAASFDPGTAPDGLPMIVEAMYPSPLNTVDFVTVPGRGGTFTVLESGRAEEARTVATFLEARTHRYLNELFADMYGEGRLTREEWDVLQVAAASAVASITGAIAALPGLSSRDIWDDAPTNSPAVEAGAPKTNPAGDSTIQGTPHQEDDMPQIEQAELDKLRESAGRAEALATENATLKADAEKRETEAKEARVAAAEKVVKEAFGEDAPAFIVESAKHAAEQGTFDEKAVREAAQAAEAHKAGQPAGLGSTHVSESAALPTDEDIANAL